MIVLVGPVFAQQQSDDQSFKFYGFVRLNATYDFKDLGSSDLFKPSAISVPAPNAGNFFMSAKQSRLGVEVVRNTSAGKLRGVIEGDFHNSSNQAGGQFRLRHAYLQWKNLTVGQAWSTFYEIKARPNIVDFEGASSSTLNRAPLIRYEAPFSGGSWILAVENPVEQVTITGDAQVAKQKVPDLMGGVKLRTGSNPDFLKVVLMTRQLNYSVGESGENQGKMAWGALVTGRHQVGPKDNVRYQLVSGSGIARYVESVRGLGYDAIYKAENNSLNTLGMTGGFLAFQHFWSDSFNSTFMAGTTLIDDDGMLDDNDYERGDYALVNLFYQPVGDLAFGLEYLYGRRENVNKASANASRVQFGATWKF